LDGTLRIRPLAGETPTVGQSYEVVTGTSLTGAFAQIDAPEGLEVSVTASGVTVTVTGAVSTDGAPPSSASLTLDAYPNPSRGTVSLRFDLPETEPVRLHIFDALGRTVAELTRRVLPPGQHEATVDGLAPGVYVAVLEAGRERVTRRVTVVR
ncbi:MAG: T9SS type A sorting domain-containing protein, partial [Bacteroidota bacterium]